MVWVRHMGKLLVKTWWGTLLCMSHLLLQQKISYHLRYCLEILAPDSITRHLSQFHLFLQLSLSYKPQQRQWGSLMLGIVKRKLLMEMGSDNRKTVPGRVEVWTRSLRITNVWWKETRGIKTMPRRGRTIPMRHAHAGWVCQHSKSVHCQEYYPVLRLLFNRITTMGTYMCPKRRA